MHNFNGSLHSKDTTFLTTQNRGFRYGDALFETIRVGNGKVYFWEDHYLRLMASMRIIRMQIPMTFTMEYLEAQIQDTITANELQNTAARIRITVFRNDGGLYTPTTNDVSFHIEATALNTPFFQLSAEEYEVELFKDFYVNPDMLSTLKTTNKMVNIVGSIFAQENGFQNCLLLNSDKKVVESLNGNLFMVKGNTITTPPKSDGCLNGIIRKKLMEMISKLEDYTLEEKSISPFDLQKADELFVTNAIVGIQPIYKYRKKKFVATTAAQLIGKLNAAARLG